MTKLEDAKSKIITKLKAEENVIDVRFDGITCDVKPFGYKFYRLNIFHKNDDGEATFSAKGVYINGTTGKYYLHSGGVPTKSLKAKEIEPVE